jgi:hypothetical protein
MLSKAHATLKKTRLNATTTNSNIYDNPSLSLLSATSISLDKSQSSWSQSQSNTDYPQSSTRTMYQPSLLCTPAVTSTPTTVSVSMSATTQDKACQTDDYVIISSMNDSLLAELLKQALNDKEFMKLVTYY